MAMKSQTVKFLLCVAFYAAAFVLLAAYFMLIKPNFENRVGWMTGIYIPAALLTVARTAMLITFIVTAYKARRDKNKRDSK